MNKMEFAKAITMLTLAYNKEYNEEQVSIMYEMLKEYNIDVLKIAIKKLIKESKFIPTIHDIIIECDNNKQHIKNDIIEKMLNDGYFKTEREYEKALHFVEENVIPDWFKKDMSHYYNLMIEQSQVKMIR